VVRVRPAAPARFVVLTVLIGVFLLAGGPPAAAHVTVAADNPQAGARNVTVTFTGEAESSRAGIASERVVLPAGIRPQDVRLARAPAGWTLTRNADGYTVAGPALPVGRDAVHAVVVAELPRDATRLAFRTVETYGDGSVSRWIVVPQPGAAEPENPAPVLTLRPAAPLPTPTSAVPAPSAVAAPSGTPPTVEVSAGAVEESGGSGAGLWIALLAVPVAVIAGGLVVAVRRRGAPRP